MRQESKLKQQQQGGFQLPWKCNLLLGYKFPEIGWRYTRAQYIYELTFSVGMNVCFVCNICDVSCGFGLFAFDF